jgi:hypothetical protein
VKTKRHPAIFTGCLFVYASTGGISGKSTTSGTYGFTVKVTDSLGNTATQSLSIKVK